MLYQILVEDIRWAKGRIWTITYYCILTYVVIIGFLNYMGTDLGPLSFLGKLFYLLLPAFGINMLAMWHIMDTHRCMCEYRARLVEINEAMEEATKRTLVFEKKYPRFHRYFWGLTLPFILLLMWGLFYVAWFIFRKDTATGTSLSPMEILCLLAFIEIAVFTGFYLHHFDKLERFKAQLRRDST